jgi:hypothetical protein
MDQLTIQYYNAVTKALGLDVNHFQLFQGKGALGTSDQAIWNIYDAIPPLSINNLYNPSQFNNFSQNYGSMLNNLKINNSITDDPVSKALIEYASVQNTFGYTTSLNDIMIALGQRGRPATIRLNYSPVINSTTQSWTGNLLKSSKSFFSASNYLSDLSNSLTNQNINISGKIDNYVIIQGWPLGTFPEDKQTGKSWYTQNVMKSAYTQINSPIWGQGNVNWNTLFGPDGNTTQFCVSLVVAQGININTTVKTNYTKTQQQQITNTVGNEGLFPLYVSQKGKGIVQTLNFSTDGHSIFITKVPPEIPYILGVNVYSINDYLQFNP